MDQVYITNRLPKGDRAFIESVVAAIVSVVVFAEPISLTAALGIALVLIAIVLLQTKNRKARAPAICAV